MANTAISPSRRIDRAILLLAVASAMIGMGMITALLAELQAEYGFADWGLGLITGSSFIAAFFAYMWLSRYSDRGHARAMFILGGLVAAAGLVWVAVAGSLWEFVIARGMLGLGEGMFIPAARRIALDWNPAEPGRELGTIHAAAVAGFVLGPLAGALLAEPLGLSVPFLIPAAAIVLALPLVARITPAPIPRSPAPGSFLAVLRRPMVLSGILLGASEFAAIGAIDTVWARLLTDRGASTTFIGVSLTVMVLPLALLAPAGGRLSDRRDPRVVGLVGSMAILPVFSLYGWLVAPVAIAVAGAVHSVLMAAVNPSAATAVARGSPPEFIARGQGMLDALGFIFSAVAAVTMGFTYDRYGPGVSATTMAIAIGGLVFAAYWVSREDLRAGSATP